MCVCPTVSNLLSANPENATIQQIKKKMAQSTCPSVTFPGMTTSPIGGAGECPTWQKNSTQAADNNSEEVLAPPPSTDCRRHHRLFDTWLLLQFIALCQAVTSLSTASPSMTGWKRSTLLTLFTAVCSRTVDTSSSGKHRSSTLSRHIDGSSRLHLPCSHLWISSKPCARKSSKTEQTVPFKEHSISFSVAIAETTESPSLGHRLRQLPQLRHKFYSNFEIKKWWIFDQSALAHHAWCQTLDDHLTVWPSHMRFWWKSPSVICDRIYSRVFFFKRIWRNSNGIQKSSWLLIVIPQKKHVWYLHSFV